MKPSVQAVRLMTCTCVCGNLKTKPTHNVAWDTKQPASQHTCCVGLHILQAAEGCFELGAACDCSFRGLGIVTCTGRRLWLASGSSCRGVGASCRVAHSGSQASRSSTAEGQCQQQGCERQNPGCHRIALLQRQPKEQQGRFTHSGYLTIYV